MLQQILVLAGPQNKARLRHLRALFRVQRVLRYRAVRLQQKLIGGLLLYDRIMVA